MKTKGFAFWVVLMLMSAMRVAAQVPYAFYKNGTLTFYYDTNQDNRVGGTVYDIPEGGFSRYDAMPGWYTDYGGDITKVVFVSTFSRTKPKSTAYWFYDLNNLEEITDMKYLNTSEVESMSWMFSGCSGLTSLDVSGFDTGKVTNMSHMFGNCSGLTSLDVSGFDTGNVTDMDRMFSGCRGLTSLDVSGFDTGNVTGMSYMFSSCRGLTSLDVSGFDTGNVTDMTHMFFGCNRLTTIYCGNNWKSDNVRYSDEMFTGCSQLMGGQGTKYDPNHTNAEYARIDGGLSAPGYFTYENNIITTVEKVSTETEQEEVVYDLQGRRVQGAARKGIYIVNGKKVVR